MNLKNVVGKQVVVQFKFALLLCGYNEKSKGVTPSMVRAKEGESLIQVPFVVGMLRQDEDAESFWLEIADEAKAGALLRIDVAPDLIASVTSLEKEPSKLIM